MSQPPNMKQTVNNILINKLDLDKEEHQ